MSTRCDSCNTKIERRQGYASIMISPSHREIDFTAAVIPPPSIADYESSNLDVCAACIPKFVAALGLPADTFVPNTPPPASGALSERELRELGLDPPREAT